MHLETQDHQVKMVNPDFKAQQVYQVVLALEENAVFLEKEVQSAHRVCQVPKDHLVNRDQMDYL